MLIMNGNIRIYLYLAVIFVQQKRLSRNNR